MSKRISLFFSSLHVGGIEKVQLNLAQELTRIGFDVDLVVVSGKGELNKQIPNGVRIIDLASSRALYCLPAFMKYLRNTKPDAVLSSQTHNNIVAILAKKILKGSFNLVVSEHTDLSVVSKSRILREKLRPLLARLFYRYSDKIVAVSLGVAQALTQKSGIPNKNIHIINNPVVTPDLVKNSLKYAGHPWFSQNKTPVILSVGRLNLVKDYSTLIRAFSLVLKQMDAYLLILGEGSERANLGLLSNQLGIENKIDMPGYVFNPYAYMSKANVFALSSIREGLPIVLIEAMACGIPVVSTNCPSGPAEILENGVFGKLVPVGSPLELANAIIETIENPIRSSILKKRANDFSVEKITKEYLKVLFG